MFLMSSQETRCLLLMTVKFVIFAMLATTVVPHSHANLYVVILEIYAWDVSSNRDYNIVYCTSCNTGRLVLEWPHVVLYMCIWEVGEGGKGAISPYFSSSGGSE